MNYIVDWIFVVFKWIAIVCSHAECTCKFGLCNPLYKQCKPGVGYFLRFLRVAEALSLSIYNFSRGNTGLRTSLTQWRHQDGVHLPLIYLLHLQKLVQLQIPAPCTLQLTSFLTRWLDSHTFPLQFFAEMFLPIIKRSDSCSSSGDICEPNLFHSWQSW